MRASPETSHVAQCRHEVRTGRGLSDCLIGRTPSRESIVPVTVALFLLFMGITCERAFAAEEGLKPPVEGGKNLGAQLSPNLPLWRALPTRSFAILGEGKLKERSWGVYAFLKKRQGHSRPCIENVVGRSIGRSISIQTGSPSCGLLAPERPSPVTSETVLSNVGGVIVGMTVAPEVRRIELHFQGTGSRQIATHIMSAAQAKKAHLRRFRYIAAGFPKAECLLQTIGFDATGATLFEGPMAECVP